MDGIRLLMLLSSLLLLLIFCNVSLCECCGGDEVIADRPSGLDGQNAETHIMWSAIDITATRSSRGQRICLEFPMVIMVLLSQ